MKKDYLNSKSIADGTKVRLYRNLTRYTNSVQMWIKNSKGVGRWIVVGYIDTARVDNAKFTVGEKTRQKCIREKKKYVHAYVVGNWRSSWTLGQGHSKSSDVDQVTYNPYKNKYFKTTDWYGGDDILPNWRGTVYFGKETTTDGTLTVWKERE